MGYALHCNGYIYFVVALKVITVNSSVFLDSCTEWGLSEMAKWLTEADLNEENW